MADTNTLIKKLAARLHKEFDWTLIPDAVEITAIELLLETGLGFLPPPYITWIQSASDGIDETEEMQLKAWLVGLMQKYDSSVPDVFKGVVASLIVSALRRGTAIVLE